MTSFEFRAEDYGPAVADLVTDRLCDLGPGHPNRDVADRLQTLSIQSVFGDAQVGNREMANCCLAGLWLWHDFATQKNYMKDAAALAGVENVQDGFCYYIAIPWIPTGLSNKR